MKTRTLPTYLIPIVGQLVLTGVFSNALAECELPPGVTPPPDPRVTAQQVEDGSGSLKDFALAARERFGIASRPRQLRLWNKWYTLHVSSRQEGSHWRSGSTYLVVTAARRQGVDSRESHGIVGQTAQPRLIYAEILSALGVPLTVLANLASSDPAIAAQAGAAVFNTLSQEPDGTFDATSPIPGLRPGIPGASGYAAVYLSVNFGSPIVLLAGFNLNETHLVEEEIDYGDPDHYCKGRGRSRNPEGIRHGSRGVLSRISGKTGDFAGSWKARTAMRDENGPWRHGPVYLYILDLTSNIVLFHGAFPED